MSDQTPNDDLDDEEIDRIAVELHASATTEIPSLLTPPPPPAAGQALPRAVEITVAVPPELAADILVFYEGVEPAARVSIDRTRRILARHALEAMKRRLKINREPILSNLAHQQDIEAHDVAKTQSWPSSDVQT